MKKVIICFIFLFCVVSVQPISAAERRYDVVPGEDFSVLEAEVLSGKGTGVLRLYSNYWGTKGIIDYAGSIHYGRIFEEQQEIQLSKPCLTITTAKDKLAKMSPEELRLFPNTILSQEIKEQWKKDDYTPLNEYWNLSKKDLTYQDLEENFKVIPKPYVPEHFRNIKLETVKVYVNDQLVQFPDTQPYLHSKGKVLVPIRPLCTVLGYQVEYKKIDHDISVVTLFNDVRTIDVSVWRDFMLANGLAVDLEIAPRLSLEERTVVPLEVLYFMVEEVEWEQEKNELKLTM